MVFHPERVLTVGLQIGATPLMGFVFLSCSPLNRVPLFVKRRHQTKKTFIGGIKKGPSKGHHTFLKRGQQKTAPLGPCGQCRKPSCLPCLLEVDRSKRSEKMAWDLAREFSAPSLRSNMNLGFTFGRSCFGDSQNGGFLLASLLNLVVKPISAGLRANISQLRANVSIIASFKGKHISDGAPVRRDVPRMCPGMGRPNLAATHLGI